MNGAVNFIINHPHPRDMTRRGKKSAPLPKIIIVYKTPPPVTKQGAKSLIVYDTQSDKIDGIT